MAEKRRDSKNRVLKNGESQRKDGRYMYKYIDTDGKVKYEYSWKLVPTDRMPAGKKDEMCLRDKIKEVEKRLGEGLSKKGLSVSVRELVDRYCEECQVKKSTKKTYGTARRRIGESTLGEMKVAHVKPMDCRKFISELKNAGVSIYTARTACYLLKRTFDLAEEDGLILRNPVGASCLEMVRVNAGTREALTEEQMASFLNVIMKDKVGQKSYDGIVLLFETGLRISEMVGLRLEDIDLTRRKISVRQQLAADKTETETKSAAGVREIPMTDMAYLSLKRILSDRNSKKVKAGFEEYVFIGKNGEAMDAGGWRQKFRRLRAKWEKRAPELATEVTPHICRHTFCSRLMAAGMNPKAVQYLMGHEDAAVTMNVYTHMTYSQVEQEMRKAKFA